MFSQSKKQFDLGSDLHLNNWIKSAKKGVTSQEAIKTFVQSLIPVNPSKVLVIAGDLGHNNDHNFEMLCELKKNYEYILIVPGNHDYYLDSSRSRYKFKKNSIIRWKDMKEQGSTLSGVHFLEGTTVTIDGVTYGGVGMWYDFSYGINNLGMTASSMLTAWVEGMNDHKYIWGRQTRPLSWFEEEKQLLEGIIDISDVVVTHVGPHAFCGKEKYKTSPITGCYFFDGKQYLHSGKDKIWCFGHTHHVFDQVVGNTRLINNSIGYSKGENPTPRQFQTVFV